MLTCFRWVRFGAATLFGNPISGSLLSPSLSIQHRSVSSNPVIGRVRYLISIILALAIIELVSSFEPNDSLFAGKAIKFGTAYYAITIALNVTTTVLICCRLLTYSRYIRDTPLGSRGSEVYDRIITIFIEAAIPFTLLGVTFIVPYAMSNDIAIAFADVWISVMVRTHHKHFGYLVMTRGHSP